MMSVACIIVLGYMQIYSAILNYLVRPFSFAIT